MKRSDIEIMAPAGSYESLLAAIEAGADSVYFGVGALNMRAASAANFTLDDLDQIVKIAHEAGVKAYLTVNTIIYDNEIEQMHAVVDRAAAAKVDAIIAADQSVILYARSRGVEIHLSTQLNISNSEALEFYAQWADVAVLARELSLDQVASIHRAIDERNICGPSGEKIRIEMFAHGALCMAVSGKCYLSLHETGCSANRGACRQICRRSYTLTDRETGAQLDTEGQWILSPKDLCTIDFLDKFINAGVRVLKIEGRARGGEYVKRVVECYDRALRMIEAGEYTAEAASKLREQLAEVFNRGFWGGYYLGKPAAEHSERYGSSATRRKVFVGKVTNFFKRISVAEILVEASPLERGSTVFFLGEKTGVVEQHDVVPYVAEREADVAVQGVFCSVKTEREVRRGDKMYKFVEAE
ncbi:MAG: U32 family peptidase [Rikenellaceae bacterium]|nr:U32 family peptidase [Rikenellaceae bacterium]